jgi:RNA polymerase sigma factor (sigma-70 family)
MREPLRAESVPMGSATGVDIPHRAIRLQSRRLLRLAGDDRLVQQIQRGSEAAFEVAFERHSPAILGFCTHMLGSREEAEDVVQHTFAAAWGDLQRSRERSIVLKPWLFTIARNRCLSVLRARREQLVEAPELATAGLAEQVERRVELRQLLADVRELPDEQREALLLAELGDLPQADIARVLGCEVSRVKGLVYRARSALIVRREARELPCDEVREQLANLRGGSLRRNELRLHLSECPGCREFRAEVRKQRQMLSMALPVMPSLAMKTGVLAAVGAGAGAGTVAGGGSLVAKLAVIGALAVGAGGTAVVVEDVRVGGGSGGNDSGEEAVAPGAGGAPSGGAASPNAAGPADGAPGGVGRFIPSNERKSRPTPGLKGDRARGRGPIEAPPAQTPVRRGPPEGKGKPDQAGLGGRANGHAKVKGNGRANGQGRTNGRGNANGKAKQPAAPGATDGTPQTGTGKSDSGKTQGKSEEPEAEPEPAKPKPAPPTQANPQSPNGEAKGQAKH